MEGKGPGPRWRRLGGHFLPMMMGMFSFNILLVVFLLYYFMYDRLGFLYTTVFIVAFVTAEAMFIYMYINLWRLRRNMYMRLAALDAGTATLHAAKVLSREGVSCSRLSETRRLPNIMFRKYHEVFESLDRNIIVRVDNISLGISRIEVGPADGPYEERVVRITRGLDRKLDRTRR